MLKKTMLRLFAAILMLPMLVGAQTTTSSITGTATTADNSPLVGATVTATHLPTGSVSRAQTRAGGRFDLTNLNPGGPYSLVVSFVNFAPTTKSDIFLNLGETSRIDFVLATQGANLGTVTVTGQGRRATDFGARGGTETTIGRDKMENLPTVGRGLSDYLRAVPQVKINGGQSIASEGAVSIAGQNVRYNSFYVDGAVNNDVFGLAPTGTNGGQSGIAPISIDAIDQFQVAVSPYNASLGNFTGGAINAITKSGTNTVHGSAYYIFRNEDLAGKTPTGPKELATKIPDFSNKTYGFTVGGPIVKNKVFFFVSAEQQRDQTPSLFTLAGYQGSTKDPATIQKLVDTIAARSGGFNVGGYLTNRNETKADRITTKIDWNINEKNKLALSYRYTGGDRLVPLESGSNALRFETNGYRFPTSTHSASAELRSSFWKNASNRLLLTLTDVEDDRAPLGSANPIPAVQIRDGANNSAINFGTEANSTFNYLKQSSYNLVEHLRLNVGKHNLTVGVEAERYDVFNSFISNTVGNYIYDNIDSFFQNKRPFQYSVNYPLLGGENRFDEKRTGSAAEFKIFKGAAFINDEIRATKNLTVTLGVRADYYKFPTKPIADTFAIDSALPKFAQYYNLKGARPGVAPTVPVAISPRIGFTYDIPEENVTIRGGFGWFTGRIPLVWPGSIYNSNGLSQGGYTLSETQNAAFRDKVRYRTTPYLPSEIGLSFAEAKGNLVMIAKEFKMPKVLRTSLAFDKRFKNGWSATVEGLFTKNVNDVMYTNVNLLPPTLKMASGPDTRSIYPASNTIPIRSNSTSSSYTGAYLISNAEGDKAFSYNGTITVNKSTREGFNMSVSYNYGQSVVLNDLQNSTPNSQWNAMESVNGRNNLTLSQSDNSVGHRVFAYASKRFTYLDKKMSTTITLTYTGQSGQPYSFVYSGTAPVRDGQNNNDLIFIPTAAQLQAMTFVTTSAVTADAATQKAALEAYIMNDKYLSTHRGQFAERNASRTPFTNIVDLKIAQNFNLKMGDRTYSAEIGYSMFNFTNFLNRDWGRQYIVNFDNFGLLSTTYTSSSNLTPRYTFNPNTTRPEVLYPRFNPTYSARWTSQLEFRIRF